MKKSLPVVSKCALIVLIFSITLMPVFSFSESLEEESSGEITLEQIEGELAAEDTDPISSEEDEEQEETISEPEKLVPSKEAEPAAMTVTMDSLVPPSPEEAIFSAAPHMAIPDVSMKIGSLVMKYPIQVPPGRNNTAPVISLNYNSSRGNGIAGVGWELNTSAIRRSTRKGLSYSGTRFTYDGEDLVPVSVDASGYGTYRPEKEQDFSIIEFLQAGSGTEDFWRVTFKNGRIHTFGSQADARQENTEGTSIWYLAEVADTFGNTIDYTYENDSGSRVRPYSISWIDSFYTVSFFYETRSDIISDCSSHSNVQTPSRLKTITVTSNSGLENVRAYALEYSQSENTGRSLLEAITLFGSDFGLDTDNTVISGSSMPPTRISYAGHLRSYRPGPDGIDGDLSIGQELTNTYEYPAVTGDFNGDGKADIGRTKDSVLQCYVSTGTGFETISSLSDLSKDQGFDNSYEHPLISGDWNGDGKTDVGRLGQSSSVFYISTGTGFSSFVTLSALSCSNGFTNVDEYPVFTGDFNGDGKTDIGRVSNSGVVIYRSTGSGFQSVTGISDLGKTAFPNNNEMPVVIGDFNGDGRIDIGRVNNTGIRIYLALEDGFTLFPGGGLTGLGKTLFPDFKEHPIITGDFNGDGLTDIGRVGTSGLVTYLSTGTGFVTGPQITNDFGKNDYPTYNEYPIFTGDFNDDSLTDVGRVSDSGIVLYRSTGTAFVRYGNDIGALSPGYGFANQSENPLFTGDYSGTGPSGIARISDSGVEVYSPASDSSADPQGPSDLPAEVIYATGSETHISYVPSSAYSNTLMPFVMQCVFHTVTEDGLGGTVATSYSYSGGLYDYSERELRSFAQVIKTLPDGTKKTFTFHQDRFLDGMIQSIEHRDTDDTLLSDTEKIWEAVLFDADSAFIQLNEQIDTFYENAKTVVSDQTFTYDDTHGSILTRTLTGTGLDDPVTTAYEYAYYGNGGTYPLKTVRQTLFSEIPEDFTRRTEYDYQTGTGFLIQETAINRTGISPATQYGCDGYGNVTSVTDPMGNTTSYTYDGLTHTYLVRIDKPLTGTDLIEHVLLYPEQGLDYRFGKPGRFTNENGFDTTYGYDLFGRIVQIDAPDGGRELFTYMDQFDTDAYIPRSVVKQVKDGESQGEDTYIRTITYVDGFNRTIQTVEKSRTKHVITLFSYDNMGRQNSVRGPFVRVEDTTAYLHAMHSAMPDSLSLVTDALWSRTHYDTRSRVVRIDSGGGITTQMAYDGLKVTVTDPDGNQTSQIMDILGRIVKVIEHIPDGTERETDYDYSIAADLVRASRQNPATLMPVENTVTYDTLGRKTEMTDPDTGTWEYTYDLNGNLKTRKDSRDVLLTFEYDELNRLTKRIYPDLTFAEYEYDAGLNGTGLLYSRTNASGTAATTFSAYDELGRVSSETRRVDNTSVVFDYVYDPAGRLSSKTITQDGNLLNMFTYEFYQGTQLLYRVEDLSGLAYAEINQYSPQGKIEAIAYGNQAVLVNYGYSGLTGRLETIYSYRTTDFIPITGKIYEYSKAGDITLISDTLNDTDRIYAYDHAHRLILETTRGEGAEAGTEVEVIEFTYGDEESNPEDYPLQAPSQIRVETTQNGTTTEKFREYSYLASGNRSNKTAGIENTFYESNPDNMISRITVNGTETLFSYDADSKRVKKQQGYTSTLYFGKNLEIINGTATLYLFAGNLRIGMIRNSTAMFYVKEHLGSTDALVRDDGLIIASTDYMPFGLDRESNTLLQTTAYKFTDQEQDAETGLYNYDARLYDPYIGQFIMADTIVPDPFNPQSLNRYAYCLNNPLRYMDPSGHWAASSVNAALAASAGANGTLAGGPGGSPFGLLDPYADMYTGFRGVKAINDTLVDLSYEIDYGTIQKVTVCIKTSPFMDPETVAGFIGTGALIGPDTQCSTYDVEGRKGAPNITPSYSANTYSGDSNSNGGNDNHSNDHSTSSGGGTSNNCSGFWGEDLGPNSGEAIPGTEKCYGGDSDNSGGDSDGGGDKIICVELYRQGFLSDAIFQADEAFGRYLYKTNQKAIKGYHLWAKPIVSVMKSFPIVTKIVFFFAKPWTEEMAHQMGIKDTGNHIGKLMMDIGIPICQFLGYIDVPSLIRLCISTLFGLPLIFLLLWRVDSVKKLIINTRRGLLS